MKFNIFMVSSYPPDKCGIGTFARDSLTDLHEIELNRERVVASYDVAAIDSSHGAITYHVPVDRSTIINAYDPDSWVSSGRRIHEISEKRDSPTVVEYQNEFGLDKTPEGNGYQKMAAYIKEYAGKKTIQLLSVHTVPKNPTDHQKNSLKTLANLVDGIIVPSKIGKRRLASEIYEISQTKLRHIDHGIRIYNLDAIDPNEVKRKYGLEGRLIIGTPGLKSIGKGLDVGIEAFGKLINSRYRGNPNAISPVYIIAGEYHQNFIRNSPELYRECERRIQKALKEYKLKSIAVANLEQLTKEELEKVKEADVIFWDSFLDEEPYRRFNRAMDVGLFLYSNDEQISSGNLAEAIGSRVDVIATRFPHAEELLYPGNLTKALKQLQKGLPQDSRGITVPFGKRKEKRADVNYTFRALDFLVNPATIMIDGKPYTAREQIAINARKRGSEMNWENVTREKAEYIVSLLEAKFIRETSTDVATKETNEKKGE